MESINGAFLLVVKGPRCARTRLTATIVGRMSGTQSRFISFTTSQLISGRWTVWTPVGLHQQNRTWALGPGLELFDIFIISF